MNALSGKIVHTYEEFNSRLTALIEELLKTINIKSLEIKSPGNESHLAWSLILIVFKSSSIKAVSLELNSSMLFFFTHFISFLAGRSLSWTISWYMGSGHTFISYGYRRYAFQRHHCGRVEKCHSRWSLRNARLPESELHRLDCRHFETSARLEADTAAGTKFLSFFCSFPFHKVYICSSRHLELKRIELDINMSYKIERDWKGFSKSLSQRLCNLISDAWKPKSFK